MKFGNPSFAAILANNTQLQKIPSHQNDWRDGIKLKKIKTMPIDKHDLIHEFPEHKDTIHNLKISDNHFAKLFAEYHEIDKEVHRIEDNIETPSDDFTHQRKIKRHTLKDQLHKLILEAEKA